MTWAVEIAARTLWMESRGEPLDGQKAVAHVIWNRVRDGRWGPNLATVCLWRAQFSGWYLPSDPNFKAACTLADDDHVLAGMRAIILTAQNDHDLTGGALYYYANSMKSPPNWSKTMTFKGQFGRQMFWTDKGAPLTS